MQASLNEERSTSLADAASRVVQVVRQPATGQNALLTLRPFRSGEVISPFGAAATRSTPTYLTVQVGEDLHIELLPSILQYMNHSCEPNSFVDTERMEVIALRDISLGEELSFFYPSSEWHMAQPFECLCGTASCLRVISGADSLPSADLDRYHLTRFIQSRLRQRSGNNV